MAKTKELNFETSLATLERIVAQLESGDLPIERALALFEEGVGLARRCQSQLDEAERKVEILLRERGEIKTVPFKTGTETESREPLSQEAALGGQSIPETLANSIEPEDKQQVDDLIPF